MKSLMLALTVILSLVGNISAAYAEGVDLPHGGGIGIRNMVYSWMRFQDLLTVCQTTHECHSQIDDSAIVLGDLLSSLKTNYQADSLEFRSGLGEPDLFPKGDDGTAAMVNAGNEIGGKIYANTNRLAFKDFSNPTGKPILRESDQPFIYASLPDTISHLTAAFAKTHGLNSETTNQLVRGIGALVNSRVKPVDLSEIGHPELTVIYFANYVHFGDGNHLEYKKVLPPSPCQVAANVQVDHWIFFLEKGFFAPAGKQNFQAKAEMTWQCAEDLKQNYIGSLDVGFMMQVLTERGKPTKKDGLAWKTDKRFQLKYVPKSGGLTWAHIRSR